MGGFLTEEQQQALEKLREWRREHGTADPTRDSVADNEQLRRADRNRRDMAELRRVGERRAQRASRPTSGALSLQAAIGGQPSLPPQQFKLKMSTYSRISQKAIERGLWAESRLYDILQHRARNQNGNAMFTVGELSEYAGDHQIDRGKVTRAIRGGDGIFWDFQGRDKHDRRKKVYRMRSKAQVCAALDLDGPGPRVDLPDVAYTGSGDQYKAYVYSAFWHGNRGEFSRSTLCKLFNCERQTLYRWERVAVIDVERRVAEAPEPQNVAEALELADNWTDRRWLVVVQHPPGKRKQAIATCGLLDAQNGPTDKNKQAATRARAVAAQNRYRQVYHAWQDCNRYTPTQTRLSAGGSSRHIKRALSGGTPQQGVKTPNNRPSKRTAGPARFVRADKAATYQRRHENAPVRVLGGVGVGGHYSARLQRIMPGATGYTFEYSRFAQFKFDAGDPVSVRRMRIAS